MVIKHLFVPNSVIRLGGTWRLFGRLLTIEMNTFRTTRRKWLQLRRRSEDEYRKKKEDSNFKIEMSGIKTSPKIRSDERAAVTKQTSNSESQPNQTFVQTQKVWKFKWGPWTIERPPEQTTNQGPGLLPSARHEFLLNVSINKIAVERGRGGPSVPDVWRKSPKKTSSREIQLEGTYGFLVRMNYNRLAGSVEVFLRQLRKTFLKLDLNLTELCSSNWGKTTVIEHQITSFQQLLTRIILQV